jgi:hypothetical protein
MFVTPRIPMTESEYPMSGLTDLFKSGANGIAGAVSEKLGVDASQVQSMIDKVIPGDDGAEPTAEAQEAGADAAPEAEEGGLLGSVSSMLGGGSLVDKAKQMLDQDGDGNPLNDIAGMASKFLGKN